VAAALKLGFTEIPVVRAAHLSPEQREAYAIAENRLTEDGCWNEPMLA
jgi:ParB-like chromosome segregation protein Spo0J